jgi:hypothetical protein
MRGSDIWQGNAGIPQERIISFSFGHIDKQLQFKDVVSFTLPSGVLLVFLLLCRHFRTRVKGFRSNQRKLWGNIARDRGYCCSNFMLALCVNIFKIKMSIGSLEGRGICPVQLFMMAMACLLASNKCHGRETLNHCPESPYRFRRKTKACPKMRQALI